MAIGLEGAGDTDFFSALGTFSRGIVNGLEDLGIKGHVETIQTTALLR